jgi:hypothetical protein
MNNQAAAMLQKSQTKKDRIEALSIFRRALDRLRQTMEEVDHNHPDDLKIAPRTCTVSPSAGAAQAAVVAEVHPNALLRVPIPTWDNHAEMSPHNEFSFYCRVLRIRDCPNSCAHAGGATLPFSAWPFSAWPFSSTWL